TVVLIESNFDDATGEQLGFAIEQLWQAGALDVFTTAISMKKNRPGVLLSVIGNPAQRRKLEECVFRHTGSLGVRRTLLQRSKMQRRIVEVSTRLGKIQVKVAWEESMGIGPRFAPEFEDCKRLARAADESLEVVYRLAIEAAERIAEEWQSEQTAHNHGGHDHDHGGHDHGGHSHDHGGHSHDHDGHDHGH
ncbi:MAG: nickel insertion protein, partial [Planctomycetota bacterium]